MAKQGVAASETATEAVKQGSSQEELRRLLSWGKDHPESWYRVCHPESFDSDLACIIDLVDQLYQAKLYTAVFFVIYSNCFVAGVDGAIDRTANECFLDTPVEVLMERFCKNLQLEAEAAAE